MISGTLTKQVVAILPDKPAAGILYIQPTHSTACHSCMCGCGATVWLLLGPIGWPLDTATTTISEPIYDRAPCASKYWVRNGTATELSVSEVTASKTKWELKTSSVITVEATK